MGIGIPHKCPGEWGVNALTTKVVKADRRDVNRLGATGKGIARLEAQAGDATLLPRHLNMMRANVAARMPKLLDMAFDCLENKHTWTAAQVQLFTRLLGKVMPDLNQSQVEVHSYQHKKLDELDRATLERLARGEVPLVTDLPPEAIKDHLEDK